ncbi:MAG TPA: two-component regulator propeller domain-containing protein [Blastocatellia bacterium]|nr:two-component regulator propeller domain-containing protein [Blastocatellia bacterium]
MGEMKRYLSPSGLLFCLFLMFGGSQSAYAQYRFDHWTADNGLPQNSVRAVLQTRDGYIWLTTFDGLVRFDGVRFTVFNKINTPGIANNRFVSIFEDRFGDLWAGLEIGGLVRRHQGRFTTYINMEPLSSDFPLYVSGDEEGNLLISPWKQWYRWQDDGFQLADDIPLRFKIPEEWRAQVLGALEDGKGNIWASTAQGLVRFRDGRAAQVYTQRDGLPGEHPSLVTGKRTPVQAISRDAAGGLWVTDLESMQSNLLSLKPPEELANNYGAYADAEGNYWFGTYGDGLFRARRQTITPYTKAQGLNAREVYTLLETRDGSIWIGTLGDGLFRFKDGVFTNYSSGGTGFSLYEDRAGQLWVNRSTRLVDGRTVSELWGESPPPPMLSAVRAMCEDRAGSYWIGMDGGVAHYLDGRMTYYTTKDGLAGNDTRVIINDTAGGLWIGSYGGLTHYKDGQFTAWTEQDGLPGSTVRSLKQDDDGTLWIGTYDSGLGRFKDGRFTRYTTNDGMFDNGVFQILEDDYGWFWMSCNRGIYRVRKQELNDFAGGRLKTIICLAYNKNDGMPSSECNGGSWPAGIKTRDGKLWFPTMGGVAMIDPAGIKFNTQPPSVVIEEMRINNEVVAPDAWNAANLNLQSAIRVLPGQDNFEIAYTATSFVNSENLRFRYKLEGADHDWVEAGTRRTAYYSHVSPGEYTFRVIAANSDGVWNQEGASLRVTVIPPFWRTWWFITLAGLGVAAVIAAAWKYRVAQLRRIQVAQEAFTRQLIASQEAERKRIAAELHDSLGQSLVIIRNWATLGSGQLEDTAPAREELDEINTIASRAINEVREIAYNLGPYHLERLGFENSIRDMVKRITQVSGIAIASELDALDGALSSETQMSLYRITQEALNNIVKHSQAGEARVVLKRETASVRLTVSDNGKGFNPHAAVPDHPGQVGFGLNGMAERVRLLGGTLNIRSAPGQGTTIETLLPERPR